MAVISLLSVVLNKPLYLFLFRQFKLVLCDEQLIIHTGYVLNNLRSSHVFTVIRHDL